MKLKNDKERLAFLDAHTRTTGWYLWKYDYEIHREWWRFDLPDASIIVEKQTITYQYPKPHKDKSILHWYIITDWHGLFADQVASRTQVLQLIKKSDFFK
mgnify:CR=1 FL=1